MTQSQPAGMPETEQKGEPLDAQKSSSLGDMFRKLEREGDCNADALPSEAQRTLMAPETSNRITKERK